jgi:hypothetical protein
MVLKPAAENSLKQALWNRKIEIAVIVFGFSTVVQTIFTVMSYYRSAG